MWEWIEEKRRREWEEWRASGEPFVVPKQVLWKVIKEEGEK
jgi:hypothetical protein